MDKKEFEQFESQVVRLRTASINEMQNLAPRTLLLGKGWRDEMVHVYIDPGREIHVLRYVMVGAGSHEQLLVLSHTHGHNGGVPSNAYFVPEKGHYPEFCDFEFCALLRSYGVALRFTKFDPEREATVGQNNGYAGPTWTADMPCAIPLRIAVQVDISQFANSDVSRELLQEACVAADVPYVLVNGEVMVADNDTPQAASHAQAFLSSLSPAARMDPPELLKAVCAAVFRRPERNYADHFELEKGGSYVFSFDFEGAWVDQDATNTTHYDGKDYLSALLGTYEGLPYLVTYAYQDWGGIEGKVHVSLFGPADKFLADMVSRYELVPAAED